MPEREPPWVGKRVVFVLNVPPWVGGRRVYLPWYASHHPWGVPSSRIYASLQHPGYTIRPCRHQADGTVYGPSGSFEREFVPQRVLPGKEARKGLLATFSQECAWVWGYTLGL